ncbi:MAG: biotin/lipoate--protein ligase family protein [Paracoccus sp. (in: a-proteobacteria)]|nr:biotin/lipoate--protein ligase family protein [Paracoccus sp. (in: a-proteobacteria)]
MPQTAPQDQITPRALTLPPPYRAEYRAQGGLFAAACAEAVTLGAGALLWSWRRGDATGPGLLELALILEPEEPLAEARLGFVAAMAALSEAIASHAPPERAIEIDHPARLIFDKMDLGTARLAHAPAAEDTAPDWMVFAATLTADRDHLAEQGAAPGATSLAEEGFTDPPAVVESFAAWFMLYLDRWKHQGAAAMIAPYADRLGGGWVMEADGTFRRGPAQVTLAAALRKGAA